MATKKILVNLDVTGTGVFSGTATAAPAATTAQLATLGQVNIAVAGKENAFSKNTAFNKNFGTGLNDVSRGNHGHSNYEPTISPKNSAFNKNFGTTPGTVSQGDHAHAYIPLAGTTALTGSIVPSGTNLRSLGSDSKRFKHIYVNDITGQTALFSSIVTGRPQAGTPNPVVGPNEFVSRGWVEDQNFGGDNAFITIIEKSANYTTFGNDADSNKLIEAKVGFNTLTLKSDALTEGFRGQVVNTTGSTIVIAIDVADTVTGGSGPYTVDDGYFAYYIKIGPNLWGLSIGKAQTAMQSPLTFLPPLSETNDVVSMAQATASVNGWLSSTDWSAFHNKGNITEVYAGQGIAGGGVSGQVQVSLEVTGVATGDYTNATVGVDAFGRIINISSGTAGPTPNNATITIAAGASLVTGGTFTLNQAVNKTITINHSTAIGSKHIPSGGSANQYLKYTSSGTAVWASLPTGGDMFKTNYATVSNTKVDTAINADNFGGQSSSFYATASSLSNYLAKAGGTMTGDITMGGNDLVNTGAILAGVSALTKTHFTHELNKDQAFPTVLAINNQLNDSNASARIEFGTHGDNWALGMGSSTNDSNAFHILYDPGAGNTGSVMRIDAGTKQVSFPNDLTAPDFITSSDKRLKTNIKPIDVKPLDIDYKEFVFLQDKTQLRYGVIAQEVEEKYPSLVREDHEGMKAVSYTDLLVREVAALKAQNKRLEDRLTKLEEIVFNKI